MDNNFLTFALSPTQLKYKKILNKDFLELEIWAISDIDPNRNNTHFTTESLVRGMKTFTNKPIVGLFKRGDFGSHDGRMARDTELDNIYWDNEYGEQILGFIRESDKVEIVQGADGLNWIHFTCVLCIRYCYQQAKKLLKDKSKKVSVEIQVTDSKIRDDGVQDIYDFVLGGVTILGTKDGKPVLEAIPGAHASILEKLDEAVLEGQREVLCYAYREVDGKRDIEVQKSNKEERIVDENKQSELRDLLFSHLSSFTYRKEDGTEDYRFSVGEVFDSYIMATDNATGKQYEVKYAVDDNEACKFECDELKSAAEQKCGCGGEDEGEPAVECNTAGKDGDADGEEGKEDVKKDDTYGAGCGDAGCPAPNPTDFGGEGDEPANDAGKVFIECKFVGDEPCAGCGELKSACKCSEQLVACKGELKTLQADYEKCCEELKTCKLACDDYQARCKEMSEKLEACKDYAEIKQELATAKEQLFAIRCGELKAKAAELMAFEKLPDEEKKNIEEKCEQGKYATEEELVRDVSYAVFKANHLSQKAAAARYEGGIAPTPRWTAEKGADQTIKNNKKPDDRAKRIADYAAGK